MYAFFNARSIKVQSSTLKKDAPAARSQDFGRWRSSKVRITTRSVPGNLAGEPSKYLAGRTFA